jgi:hypothetical protein
MIKRGNLPEQHPCGEKALQVAVELQDLEEEAEMEDLATPPEE